MCPSLYRETGVTVEGGGLDFRGIVFRGLHQRIVITAAPFNKSHEGEGIFKDV